MSSKETTEGVILIVSGPSGAGKSTICQGVRKVFPELQFSISCTTRSPRPGEQNSVDYFFIDKDEFKNRIANNEFIEYAEVFGNFYGTLKAEALAKTAGGADIFLDIDVQGAMQIKAAAAKDPVLARRCEFIFIAPPSVAELEKRLRSRNTESEEELQKRLGMARSELASWRKYDYLIVNDSIDEATGNFIALLKALHCKSSRLPKDKFND